MEEIVNESFSFVFGWMMKKDDDEEDNDEYLSIEELHDDYNNIKSKNDDDKIDTKRDLCCRRYCCC